MPPVSPSLLRRPVSGVRKAARRLWPLGAALALALAGFQLVFGLRLVSAGDAYWSAPFGDMTQMLAGELAGLRAPWSLPILTPDTLLAPDRVSLVYTDSIPWLTALLKLTHLGRAVSLLGSFLLLAWLAQPAAMWALLRAAGVRRGSTLLAGSVLALLVPAWLARQLGHVALAGHALQIAALALAVHAARRGMSARTAAGFVGLGVLAVGVHAYHVPVVTLLLAAALAAEALQRRPGALARGAAVALAYAAAGTTAAWTAGYFVGRGASGGVDVLGFYEMNLAGPLWPQASALAGQRWTGDWFTRTFDPTGGQWYEGFNYLGGGVLLLLVAAAVLLWRARRTSAQAEPAPPPERDGPARRWGPLAAALALLWLYALGTQPYLGPLRLFTLPLPHAAWMEPLALFRCHGRFFWTVGYALLAGALTTVDRAAGPRTRAAVLLAAVALQAADVSGLLWGLHDRFSRPEPLRYPPALAGPAFRGRALSVFPTYFCTSSQLDQALLRQLSLLAQRQGASINTAETARPPVGGCRPPPDDARVDAPAGDRRVTVLLSDDGQSSPLTALFARRRDCRRFAAGWMCGRDLSGVAGAATALPGDLAYAAHAETAIGLDDPRFRAALASGWSKLEPNGVWSDGPRAVLRLPTPPLSTGGVLRVTLDGLGYQPPEHAPQRALVSVRGRALALWRLDRDGYRDRQVSVPAALITPGAPLELVIDLPDALSPNAVFPGSGDPRRLGIGVRRITLAH